MSYWPHECEALPLTRILDFWSPLKAHDARRWHHEGRVQLFVIFSCRN